jgi:hypothetical protein
VNQDAAKWKSYEVFDSRTARPGSRLRVREKNTDKNDLMRSIDDKANPPGWQDMIGLIFERDLLKLTDDKSNL